MDQIPDEPLRYPKEDAAARQSFVEKIAQYEQDGRSVVWTNESGLATDMPRPHGDSPRGQRCVGHRNWHAKGRINVFPEARNHILECLPPYSPGLNKIEPKRAQAKAIRRKTGKATDETFRTAF